MRGAGGGGTADAQDAQAAQEMQGGRADRRDAMRDELDTARNFNPEVIRLARIALLDGKPSQEELVEKLLKGSLDSSTFLRQMEQLENEEQSWKEIFSVQRQIREKIAHLQSRTQSYIDVIPAERQRFQAHLIHVRALNTNDARLDVQMKQYLGQLSRGENGRPPVLSPESAKALYELDPDSANFDTDFKNLTSDLGDDSATKKIVSKIFDMKREERDIVRHFKRLVDELESILERNTRDVQREANKKRMLKLACSVTGIRLRSGTTIRYQAPGLFSLFGGRSETTTIQNVAFEEVPIRDKTSGKVIGYSVGAPLITLANGTEMPVGRFKKWVDATDAIEEINGITDVMDRIGWDVLGLDLKPGTSLYVPRKHRKANGELETVPEIVTIRDVKDGVISFATPIFIQKGPTEDGQSLEQELVESLSFGEFAKWYQRMEVEKSMELEGLRDVLARYNTYFNKEYNIGKRENPPIGIMPGELLYFADGSDQKFTIQDISGDRIVLEDGKGSFSYPEFFFWVKNNNVQRYPEEEGKMNEKDKAKDLSGKKGAIDAAKDLKDKEDKKPGPSALEGRAKTIEELALGEHGTLMGHIQHAWASTTILSLMDCWNLTIAIKEFIERKHDRRSKMRYATIAQKLPGTLGTEFGRIAESAEHEEVNHYKEAMEHWGVFHIKHTLHSTNSKDEAKACMITLVEKGELRWDDPGVWSTLNRLTASYTERGAELYIPTDIDKQPFGTDVEQLMKNSMDALWGDGQGNEWWSKNINTYNSNKSAYEHKGKQLDSDPKNTGGLGAEEARMLESWCKGNYVNPHEYEEMVEFAIKYGKMTAEEKMFFLFAGVSADCGADEVPPGSHHYGTLLHIDRPSALDGEWLNQFPVLDYFRQRKRIDPLFKTKRPVGPDGRPIAFTKEEFGKFWHHWKEEGAKQVIEENIERRKNGQPDLPPDWYSYRPGKAFKKFFWEEIMLDPMVRVRLSKGLRASRKMDHDDTHMFIPPATVAEIESLTKGPAGGGELNFTPEGYANAYPGYNQFFTSTYLRLQEYKKDAEEKKRLVKVIRNSIQSFITYDAIMDERLHKLEGPNRGRLLDHHYDKVAVVDGSCHVRLHQDQLRNFIQAIARAYNKPVDSWLYQAKTSSIKDARSAEAQKQIHYEESLQNFVKEIDNLIASDGGEKLLAVLGEYIDRGYKDGNAKNALRGLQGSRRPKSDEESGDAEHTPPVRGGHGGGHGGGHH
ncbi:MAG: hypothetical protein AAB592_05660 [Patescibacteria group bacterium]